MPPKPPRIAVRAVIVHDDRLLLVNAWPDGKSDLLCAPGGGVEPGASLRDNLIREVHEETGLHIRVGAPCLINEFHNPEIGFHQIEVFFRCTIDGNPQPAADWVDPEGVVTSRYWVGKAQIAKRSFKPDSLASVAFSDGGGATYDPLERIVM
ncbi:MAG: NUDIX hydrolase [Sulfitobacter sp.]